MDSQLFEIHTLLLSQGAKKYKIFVRHVNKKFYICVEKNYNQNTQKYLIIMVQLALEIIMKIVDLISGLF